MQFIVKPQQNPFRNILSKRNFERNAPRWLIIIALAGCFTSGFLIGSLTKFDINCKVSDQQSLLSHPSKPGVSKVETYLIVLILSAKHFKDRRDAIRRTWITFAGDRQMKIYFVLGTLEFDDNELDAIKKENQTHRDILVFPQVKDTYVGLTHKLIAALRYSNSHFIYEYLLKVDDDSFVRIDSLFDELIHKKEARLYWGYFVGNSQVKRTGQWAEKKWFLSDRYLPYAVGGGYVLSHHLVDYLATNAHLLQLYSSEDVSVGTWLASLDIVRLHDTRFDTWYRSRGCSNEYLISHKQSLDNMLIKYDTLQRTGYLCSTEKFVPAYVYNWTVIPSKCCKTFDNNHHLGNN